LLNTTTTTTKTTNNMMPEPLQSTGSPDELVRELDQCVVLDEPEDHDDEPDDRDELDDPDERDDEPDDRDPEYDCPPPTRASAVSGSTMANTSINSFARALMTTPRARWPARSRHVLHAA
jgi:hypothetical protein